MFHLPPMLLLAVACTPNPGDRPPGGDDDDVASPVGCDVETTGLEIGPAPTGREHDRLVTVTLSAEADAALLCHAEDDPDDRFLLEAPAAEVHEFRLQGLRGGATYTCSAGATCAADAALVREASFTTAPPRLAPEVEVTVPAGRDLPEGWLLAGVLLEGCRGLGSLAVFDTAGRVRWDLPLHYAYMDAELLHVGDGVLVYGGSTSTPGPQALHLWDGLVWQADLPDLPEGPADFHHDAKQIADGRVITLEAREVSRDDRTWRGFGVRAFDPATMEVSFEYDSQRAVDEGVLHPKPVNRDAWHANWIDLLDHGAGPRLYVSLCHNSQVLAVDATTQEVDWLFGPGGDFALYDLAGNPLGDDQFSQCQHGLDISADGSRMLVYDNGRDRGWSRVVEYELDVGARRATLLWDWTDGWQENILGDADWLPDGDVLVTQGHPDCYDSPGDRTELVKVTPETGAESWRLAFLSPLVTLYRSELLGGCELFANVGQCPALEPRWAELAEGFGIR